MGHLNVEIKARCGEPARIRGVLETEGADFRGTDRQTDTYFRVAKGRLKLREGNIENHLIYYRRVNEEGPKRSQVMLHRTEPGSGLKNILAAACGVKVVVKKRREIYFLQNVKFHIDEVEGLGAFVEIEAIDLEGDLGEEKLRKQCEYYMGLLGIDEQDLLSASYSDYLMRG